jgi:hypothetical protein
VLTVSALGAAPAAAAPSSTPTVSAVATPTGKGYWMLQRDGTVTALGDALKAARVPGSDVAAIAPTPSGKGYWTVTARGTINTFGDAHSYGSLAGERLNRPIVGMAASPTGHGYWLAATDGGVFGFGDAHFHGSAGGLHLVRPIVGIAATPTGNGYWLVAFDGGIFGYGDAHYYGSTGARHLVAPISGISASRTGHGYRLVAWDGGVFGFGDAHAYGSMSGQHLSGIVVQIASTRDGKGYWEFGVDGVVYHFGDAYDYGSAKHPLVAPETDFVFPFQDHHAPAPSSVWTQDQGVDVFLRDRGAPWCGSIDHPIRRDGPVLAAVASGTIVGEGINGFGPSAPILHVDHGALKGMYVYYGHSSGDLVPVGAHVQQGQPITHIGCGIVGISDEPHVEIGMYGSYPGVPPCNPGCHGSSTSAAMLHWLLKTI